MAGALSLIFWVVLIGLNVATVAAYGEVDTSFFTPPRVRLFLVDTDSFKGRVLVELVESHHNRCMYAS